MQKKGLISIIFVFMLVITICFSLRQKMNGLRFSRAKQPPVQLHVTLSVH
jgi:hypothetical protein